MALIFISCHDQYCKSLMYSLLKNLFDNAIEAVKQITKGNKEEHGLGLRIVENIVKRHDGQIVIDDTDHYFRIKVLLYHIGK